MAKQAVTASLPAPAIRQPVGERVQRVTGAADAGEVPAAARVSAPAGRPPMAPDPQVQKTHNEVSVKKWGNGGPVGSKMFDDETPPTAALGDQTGGSEGAAGDKPKTPKDRDEPLNLEEETPAAAAAAPAAKPDEPPPTAKRSAALANLEAERKARELEAAVKKLQDDNAELAKQLTATKAMREGTVVARMKALGLSKAEQEELLEKLLTKDPELAADAPDKPAAAAKKSPEVLALEEKLDALQKRLDERDGNDGEAQLRRAVTTIAEDLKDEDLPLTHSEVPVTIGDKVVTPYHLALQVANQMWLDSGKNGHPRDYIKKAGANVEAHLREKNPKLAARLDAQAAAGGAAPAPAAAGGGSPSLGKRTGKGAPSAPPKLSRDRDQRDQEIKREMGWG